MSVRSKPVVKRSRKQKQVPKIVAIRVTKDQAKWLMTLARRWGAWSVYKPKPNRAVP